jgi:hypothetical protein
MTYWIQLIVGIWILISPWLLGFSSISVAKWSNVAAGLILVLIALWSLFGGSGSEPLTGAKK